MTEPLKTETVLYAWDHEVSSLATAVYQREYNAALAYTAGEGCAQDTCIRLTVPGEDWEYEERISVSEWLATDVPTDWESLRYEQLPSLQGVANDLHQRGLMPAGDYVIHVWW